MIKFLKDYAALYRFSWRDFRKRRKVKMFIGDCIFIPFLIKEARTNGALEYIRERNRQTKKGDAK